MKFIANLFRITLIILLPHKYKKSMSVAFIYDLPNWTVHLVSLFWYERLHSQAKRRMNGCIKKRAPKNFNMRLLWYRLDMMRKNLEETEEAQRRQNLVDTASNLRQISSLFHHVRLDMTQRHTLLKRMCEIFDGMFFLWGCLHWRLFIQESLPFPDLHDKRTELQQYEKSLF